MQATISAGLHIHRYTWVAVLVAALAGTYAYMSPMGSFAAEESLFGGRVTSSAGGAALAGIPVRAHRENSNITVIAYTNGRGEYSFPGWSDLSPGSYSIAIELADFDPVKREGVTLATGKTARLDFTLQSRKPSLSDATAAEIAMAMPGTEEQKFMLTQCSQCHSLQHALRNSRSKDAWLQTVKRMAGAGRGSEDPPSTKAFDQRRLLEPMADYLASIRGPGSSGEIPFKLRPRPTGEASTRIVVTEYDVPRGGSRDLYLIRGDRRFAWPHDVLVDPNGQYVWYTDHFTTILGRLDRKTGEVKEFPYQMPSRMGREDANDPTGQGRAGNPGGGAHDIAFDPQGNIIFGVGGGVIRFDPRTENFTPWPGAVMFGIDPAGNVWYLSGGALHKLDPNSGAVKQYPAPPKSGGYDMEVDSQGRSVYNTWRGAKIGIFDPKTEKFTEYPTPTPESGPRRGEVDAKDRVWTALYWAGRIAMFDPSKGEVREFPLLPDVKPFGAPFLAPYSVSVDDKNQFAWTTDFNSSRIYRLDMNTGQSTEYFMPQPYELRDITADRFADRPTVWLPVYRAPSKIVKVQVW